MSPCRACLLLCLLPSCARGDGDWLTTVVPGPISAQLSVPAERVTKDGWLITTEGFEVRMDSLQLAVTEVTLSGTPAGDAGPADGSAPAPAGEVPGQVPLLTLGVVGPGSEVPVATRIPLTPIGGVPLSGCWPRCGLEAVTLTAGRLVLSGARAMGTVRDGTQQKRLPQPLPLGVDVSFPTRAIGPESAGVVLTEALHQVLDRSTPARALLSIALQITPSLWDGVRFDALGRNGGGPCLAATPPSCTAPEMAAQLQSNLRASTFTLDLADATTQ